jgi:hypothetical protein
MGKFTLSQKAAWASYDALCADGRVVFADDPPSLEDLSAARISGSTGGETKKRLRAGPRTEVTEITEEVLSSPPVRTRSSEKDRARENAGTAS